jgi:iron complex transport system substrate-binding protein
MRRFAALGMVAALGLAACGSSKATTATTAPAAAATTAAGGVTTATTLASTAAASAAAGTVAATVVPTTAVATTTPATSATTAPKAAFPVTIQTSSGPVTITDKPDAIVSLSPSSTEDLFAIGAGDQVKAVDDQSTYPDAAKAKSTKLSGFTPNIEAIAGYNPDLVIISADTKDGIVAALGKLGITVLVAPSAKTFDDVYSQISQLGAATGHTAEAATLVSGMKSKITSIVSSAKKPATPVTYFHELDNTLYAATSTTFIGSVYNLFGMKNIADAADKAGSGYPQLSVEALISANPQLIFLADAQYGESVATVSARPGWKAIAAVANKSIIETPADIASRWGPRIVDYVQVVATALAALPA